MTDNRTTELLKDYAFALRRLEYDADKPGSNMTLGEYEAEEKRVTDEYAQAIAATLGNGTLTAEQVRDAVLENFEETHETYYDHWEPSTFDWQEIADELNAERHVETCRITASSTDGLCSDNPRHYFELSCGHSFTINGLDAPVACAVCGKVVKNAD